MVKEIERHPHLWGLFHTEEEVMKVKKLTFEQQNALNNFFQWRAMQGMQQKGIIPAVTKVASLEQATT